MVEVQTDSVPGGLRVQSTTDLFSAHLFTPWRASVVKASSISHTRALRPGPAIWMPVDIAQKLMLNIESVGSA